MGAKNSVAKELMDHRTNENYLVLEQKVMFERSWKLNLLSAHSEFLIYG